MFSISQVPTSGEGGNMGMAKSDTVGKWSLDKLQCLKEYLEAYSSIMHTQRSWLKGHYYIDAFAGSVTPWDRDSQEYIDGSPLVALKIEPQFDGYYFIEKNSARIRDKIKPLKNQFPSKAIHIHHGDCNDVLLKEIIPQFSMLPSVMGFVFLDPYGIQVCFETIKDIAGAKIFDIFVNFSVMGIYRQLRGKPPVGNEAKKISQVMGCEDWVSAAYAKNLQLTLLDGYEPSPIKLNNIASNLAELYRRQLNTCFPHVSKAIIMRNSKNGPIYALILASHKELAVKKMHEIFRRGEKRKRRGQRLDTP
jgi:three-Cys-motif partner protein